MVFVVISELGSRTLAQADLFGLHNPETDCLTLRAEFDESVADRTSDGLRRLG